MLSLLLNPIQFPVSLVPFPPLLPFSPNDVGPPQLASTLEVASGSRHLDAVLEEDCTMGSDDEILDEDQLDFNFTDEECEASPAMLPAPNLSSPPSLLPAENPPLLQQNAMPSAPISGSKEFAPPPLQVNLSLLLTVTNGEIFSLQINLLPPTPNFKIFLLITFPNLVIYPLRIFSHNLKFGIFMLWVTFLEKILASELLTILCPLFGNVRLHLLYMRLAG